MKIKQKKITMFGDLDFKILDTSHYKEDSVREDIVVPILKRLGYSSSGTNKILRGIPLTHPFVNIGSAQRKINIIPDYILETINGFKWILDAKAPNENILKSKNVEQAYSYAINPEVRCDIYALCNGRKLTVFHISIVEPILDINLEDIDIEWKTVEEILSPLHMEKPYLKDFLPDFGLHLLKVGSNQDLLHYILPAFIQYIGKVNEDKYTLFSTVEFGEEYVASFDFGKDIYEQFIQALPLGSQEYVLSKLRNAPFYVHFPSPEQMIPITIAAKRGAKIVENNDEYFVPFQVVKFENF